MCIVPVYLCRQDLHINLEREIAEFHGKDDAVLYPSCFDANGGLFETFLTEKDAVFSDELNHASIIDGLRLCKAQKYRYKNRGGFLRSLCSFLCLLWF